MARTITLEQILALSPEQIDDSWEIITEFVGSHPEHQQAALWLKLADTVGKNQSRGLPFFRVGILKLSTEDKEDEGIGFLEAAYTEDQKFGPPSGRLPHRMGAYRLLSLMKPFFHYLHEQRGWQQDLLRPENRRILVATVLATYDRSLIGIEDMPSSSYRTFFELIPEPKELCRFAMENYYCAADLIELFFAAGQPINKARDEYPLARSVVALFAGVLEAFLIAKIPSLKSPTLGALLREAHQQDLVSAGSKLSALSSLMLHLRNYVHADLDSRRTEYYLDMNTAKGCKAALDWAIAEILDPRRA